MKKTSSPLYLMLDKSVAWIWWHLPLSRQQKEHIKSVVFTGLKIFFMDTQVYRNWESGRFLPGIESDSTMHYNNQKFRFHQKDLFQIPAVSTEPITSLAIVIHAFYPEILEELLTTIGKIQGVKPKFFITSPAFLKDSIHTCLLNKSLDYEYVEVENKGRDILPFFTVMPKIIAERFQIILKIHTKKSAHLKTGFLWRNDLYQKLLHEKSMKSILQLFSTNPDIGLIGPAGHLVPMNLYYGSNSDTLKDISHALNVTNQQLLPMNFVAGSMFYIRAQALLPLLNLDLQSIDFEPEQGQIDGTLAHALERAFAISTHVTGFKLVDSAFRPDHGKISVIKDYKFTR